MTPAELEAIRARDANMIEMSGSGEIVAAFHDRRALLTYVDELVEKLRELAGECAHCGGTGQAQQGCDPAGKPAMFPCDACWDIRELLPGKPSCDHRWTQTLSERERRCVICGAVEAVG